MNPQMSRLSRSVRRLAVILALVVLAPVAAQAAPYAAVVMDMRSGEILHARNHDTRLHPASLTKMMTLYIAFEAVQNGEITLDTPVRISANAARQPCSCLGLRAGQSVALRHLIRAAALRSGNDAATAIGEAISGSERAFIERMNRTARAMGMNSTSFRNAHGLTASGHLSTARDMTTLGRQLYFDFPQYYNLFSRRSADAGLAHVPNTNRAFLDSYRGADGIKTGFTRAAGFNLTASAERGGKRIIVTMFGGASVADRTRRVSSLMDLGFSRAPARVAVRRPAAPNYGSQPVATAAASSAQGERPAAGRTIRPNTAVTRSPIPAARPVPASEDTAAPVLVAMQEDIDAVLAAVAEAGAAEASTRPGALAEAVEISVAEATEATAAPAARPDDLPFAVADAAEEALAAVQAEEPASGEAAEAIAEAGAAEELAISVAVAAAGEPMPAPRPEDLPFEVEGSETATASRIADSPFAVIGAEEAAAAISAAAAASNEAGEPAPAATLPPPRPDITASAETAPASLVQTALAMPDAPATHAQVPPPQAPAERLASSSIVLTFTPPVEQTREVQLASLAEAAWAEPAQPLFTQSQEAGEEVVARPTVSTSSPRRWSVSLGRYATRDAAERALMQAALAELAPLDGGLRRIQRGANGFKATFVGLSEEQAHMACSRLAARGVETCQPLGP